MKELLTVFTCLTGGKDDLPRVPLQKGVRYVCYTDRPFNHDTWEYRPLEYTHEDNRRIARWHKVNSHLLFPDAEHTLWVDGHLELKFYPRELLEIFEKNDCIIASLKHPSRDCIYQEFQAVRTLNLDEPLTIAAQERKYFSEGMPSHYGLPETGVTLRKHGERCTKFNELWWNEINNYSKRDQLSYSYVAWKTNEDFLYIPQWMIIKRRHKVLTSKDT